MPTLGDVSKGSQKQQPCKGLVAHHAYEAYRIIWFCLVLRTQLGQSPTLHCETINRSSYGLGHNRVANSSQQFTIICKPNMRNPQAGYLDRAHICELVILARNSQWPGTQQPQLVHRRERRAVVACEIGYIHFTCCSHVIQWDHEWLVKWVLFQCCCRSHTNIPIRSSVVHLWGCLCLMVAPPK